MKSIRDFGFVFGLAVILLAVVMMGLLWIGVEQPAQAAPGEAPMMARVTSTVTVLSRDGVTQTLGAAASDGEKFSNNGKTFVVIANGYTATITGTFVTPGTIDGLAIDDKEVAVPVGETYFAGPFPPSQYNQPSGSDLGYVYLNWSQVTSVTYGVWRLP